MRTAALSLVLWTLVACTSSDVIIDPQPSSTDACPAMDIQGSYADTTNQGRAGAHTFMWETRNWEVSPEGGISDARVRGEIDTEVVTGDGQTVPITVSVLADVFNPFFVACRFEDVLDQSAVVIRDGTSIQSASGMVSGHFVAGRDPAVLIGEYDIRVTLADGRSAEHSDSWQAPIL